MNGQEITLFCIVKLHIKAACVYNGKFAKINNHYNAITHWSLAINAF